MDVLVAGAGKVGSFIAGQLVEAGHRVLLLEVDPARVAAAQTAGELPGVQWRVGDACEPDDLAEAGCADVDVVAAVTGDDEDNLVISLLAKQEFGVPRVVARVNHPENEWLFNEGWGVDVSVSTPHLLTALVSEAVSVGSLVRLLAFEGGRARLDEVTLAVGSPAADHAVEELGMPRDSSVVAIIRQDHVIVPRGDSVLRTGDRLLLLVTTDTEEDVRSILVGAHAAAAGQSQTSSV
jgi:trk system potassium uptake protein TrkA